MGMEEIANFLKSNPDRAFFITEIAEAIGSSIGYASTNSTRMFQKRYARWSNLERGYDNRGRVFYIWRSVVCDDASKHL